MDAAAKASFTSSGVVPWPSTAVRSVIEPTGTGTRIEVPLSLPSSSGNTRPIAFAAPVLAGMMESAAARMRRMSALPERLVCAMSWRAWSLVYA